MRVLIAILIAVLAAQPLPAYSVLAHEAIVDACWKASIRPLLVQRYPSATEDRLQAARAFAYGGSIIQDMGYYPMGSKFFSDLTHYVRSGDFVAALIRDAQDVNEYAFALGSAAHYAADNVGHPDTINRTVPIMYPKLRAKFGDHVTYEDNPAAHLKVEFAFDVVQVATGQYAPQTYHDFIGFSVSKELLSRAFEETYGLPIDQVFKDLDRALGTYRFAVSSLIPEMTKTAWASKKGDIQKLQAGMTQKHFVYRLSRTTYHKEWDRSYDRPGTGARFLAWLIRILPKVGPLKALAFKVPTPEAEKLFLQSFTDITGRYQALLREVGNDRTRFPNENFDIGKPTTRGTYHMADLAYDKLLEKLNGSPKQVSPELRADILRFYGSAQPASENARATLAGFKGQ